MTAAILDILAAILGVIIAPLCLIGIIRPKTRIGHTARIGAGIAIVLFFLTIWGNTGRDPLQWGYCFVVRTAPSCRDIKWSAGAGSVPINRPAENSMPKDKQPTSTATKIEQSAPIKTAAAGIVDPKPSRFKSERFDADISYDKSLSTSVSSNSLSWINGIWSTRSENSQIYNCKDPEGFKVRGMILERWNTFQGGLLYNYEDTISRASDSSIYLQSGAMKGGAQKIVFSDQDTFILYEKIKNSDQYMPSLWLKRCKNSPLSFGWTTTDHRGPARNNLPVLETEPTR